MRIRDIAAMLSFVLLLELNAARAEVRLAPCVGSNMVFQRDVPARLVGWADAGEPVTVKLGGQVVGKAVGKGQEKDQAWTVTLPVRKQRVSVSSPVRRSDAISASSCTLSRSNSV